MGIIGRQSIKSTIYIYMGVVIGFVLRAHLFPNFLTEAEIGILALLVSYSSIYSQLALLGFNHGTIKYFPYFQDKEKGHHGFLSLYLTVAAVGFLMFLVIQYFVGDLVFGSGSEDPFKQYYYLCIPLTGALLLFLVLDNYNTVLYNATTGILLREFVLRTITAVFLLPLIFKWMGFETYVYLYVGAFCLITLMLLLFLIWRGEFHLRPTHMLWDRTMLKSMAGISFFGMITGLNTVLILQVNNILIDQFYDEAMTGIYVTNFFFATLILLPSRGLNKIAPTIISNAFKSSDMDTIQRVHYKSTINQMLIALLLFLGLFINLHNIYRILPESFAVGQWVIILVGLANVIQMAGGVSSAIIGFSAYFRYNTYLTVAQLVVLVAINLVLLPSWGITGAAMGSLAAIVVLNFAKFLILKAKFRIQPYRFKHLLGLLVAILCLGINYIIPNQSGLVADILLRSTVISIIFVGLIYILKISQELDAYVNKTLEKLKIR